MLRRALWRLGEVEVIRVPFLGDSVASAKLSLKLGVGAPALELSPLCEVEGDKTAQQVNAPFDGKIVKIIAQDGDTLEINAPIMEFEECDVSDLIQEEEPAEEPAAAPAEAPSAPAQKKTEERKKAQPPPQKKAAVTAESTTTRVALSQMRQAIQTRLMEAKKGTAMLTTFQEIDMGGVMAMRTKYGEDFEEQHGVKLGLMSPFVKASATALGEYPIINAAISGADVVYHSSADIGVAVATPTGLVVPVIRDCGSRSFASIEKEISGFAEAAKDGRISLSDMAGGTFTISNGGTFGSLFGTPILNSPQSALLGMHSIFKRVVPDAADNAVVRPMMVVALTFDHRLIEEREANLFLIRVKQMIEDPSRFMLQ